MPSLARGAATSRIAFLFRSVDTQPGNFEGETCSGKSLSSAGRQGSGQPCSSVEEEDSADVLAAGMEQRREASKLNVARREEVIFSVLAHFCDRCAASAVGEQNRLLGDSWYEAVCSAQLIRGAEKSLPTRLLANAPRRPSQTAVKLQPWCLEKKNRHHQKRQNSNSGRKCTGAFGKLF